MNHLSILQEVFESDTLIDKIKKNPRFMDILNIEYDVMFDSDEVIRDNFEALTEFGYCKDYIMQPFAADGAGGVYVFLNNTYIGYISSEGEAGIIAKNLKEFCWLLFNCNGSWYDYCEDGVFDNYENFVKKHFELEKRTVINEEVEKFITENNLTISLERLFSVFREAISVSPNFVILPTNEDYVVSEDFFGTEQKYIEKLRRLPM